MSRERYREEIIEYLQTIRPGLSIDQADEEISLVEAGLIDSLGQLEIVLYLEERYGIDFAKSGVDLEELGSVAKIVALVERRTAG